MRAFSYLRYVFLSLYDLVSTDFLLANKEPLNSQFQPQESLFLPRYMNLTPSSHCRSLK